MKNPEKSIFRSVIEVSHVEFQLYDLSNRHLICTSGLAEKVLGYSKDELNKLSANFYEKLIHANDLSKVQENVENLIKSKQGEIIEMTVRYRRSDDTYIWVYTRKMVTERDVNNNPKTIVTIAEEVTQMINIQGQLKEKVEQLQLISYKNSHELRGPVTSIIGLLDLIEEDHVTSEHNLEILDHLKHAITKLDRVVWEINDTTKSQQK